MWQYGDDYIKEKYLLRSVDHFKDFVQKHLPALNGPPDAGKAKAMDLSDE
jgi:hypothetical protein